jgi:hypothetical protein
MADFNIQPVATQIRPVQGASLADMVNIARGAQAYQQAQQINPIELQTAQQQLSRLQQLTPEEVARAQAEANVATQTQQPRIRSAEAGAQTAETGTQSAQLEFANKQVNAVAGRLTSLINNPLIIASEQNPQAVNPTQLMGIVKKYGEEQATALGIPKEKADQLLQPYLEQATTNPAGIRQFLKDKLLSTLDQGSRIGAMQPSGIGINTGAGGATVQTGQFGPYAPGQVLPGTAFETQVGPSQRMVDTGQKDINNNPIFNVLSPSGQVLGQTTVPTTVQPQQMPGAINQPTTPAMPVTRIPAGQSAESGKLYEGEIITARNAAVPSKIAVNNIDTILKYLPMAQTGKASEAFAGLQSILGNVAGSKPEELAAAARDIIQKNIVDLALQKNAALGGKFASSLEASLASLAQAEKNPTAIAKSLEQLRPLMQHSYNYTIGLDRAIEKSPDKQYVKPKFDSAMNEAFDMKALMLKNSFDLGGKKGLDKFTKDNSINLVEQQKLLDKLERYRSLVNGEL